MKKTGDFCQMAKMKKTDENFMFGKEIMVKTRFFSWIFHALRYAAYLTAQMQGFFVMKGAVKDGFKISLSQLRNLFRI